MNIAVIGIGGVGGYYGGKLAQLLKDDDNLNLFFIARNQHLIEIKRRGLILETDESQTTCSPTLATDNISELPQIDFCLLCVKSYDLAKVLIQLKSKITDETMILPLLNGIDIYERIRSVINYAIVFPACVYIETHIEKPGKVVQRGGPGNIYFGKDPSNSHVDPELFKLLQKSKIKYSWKDNPYIEIWGKYIFIASFGMVAAYSNKTIGEVMQSEELSRYVKDIMEEIYQIAMAKQIFLSKTIVYDSYLKGNNFSFDAKTSFQRDYENKDKPDERDIFGGTIIRMGEQLGIKTETTKMIYSYIQQNKTIK
jgi:2-dehydropantoate 2-reductase